MYRLRIGDVYWPWVAYTDEQLFRMAFRFAREWYVEERELYDWKEEFLPRFTGNVVEERVGYYTDCYVLVKYGEDNKIKVHFEEL